MRKLILSGLFLLFLTPVVCLARLELGVWPLFGMQRNNDVVIANDYTGLGGTARLGWVLDSEAVAGFSILLDFNYLDFGNDRWLSQLYPRVDMFCDVYSEYRLVSLCPGLSFGLRQHNVRPYCEIFGGPARFTIRNNFNNNRYEGEPLDQTEDFSRSSFVLGAGGGLKIVLWDKMDTDGNDFWLKNVAVDVKANYQYSGSNKYIVKQKLQRPGQTGPALFTPVTSKANLILFRFGIVMQML